MGQGEDWGSSGSDVRARDAKGSLFTSLLVSIEADRKN